MMFEYWADGCGLMATLPNESCNAEPGQWSGEESSGGVWWSDLD